MSDAQEMERFFRERGFGQLIGWGDSPALLVIDFTRAFTDPALPLGSNLDRELAETVRVLGVAREAAVPIYYSSVCYEDKDLRDAGLWAKKIAGTMTLRAGTPEVEIDPRLGRRADEAIIVKKYGSVVTCGNSVLPINSTGCRPWKRCRSRCTGCAVRAMLATTRICCDASSRR